MSKADTKGAQGNSQGANDSAYGRVTSVISAARDKAGGAVQGLEANPLAALLGGIALGAIAGALVPRIDKERELLSGLGERLGDAARAALDAGRTAGVDALGESGLTTENLRAQVATIVEQAIKAATAAGGAAVTAARDSAR